MEIKRGEDVEGCRREDKEELMRRVRTFLTERQVLGLVGMARMNHIHGSTNLVGTNVVLLKHILARLFTRISNRLHLFNTCLEM